MSKYTTEVRYICEQAAGLESSSGYGKIQDIIKVAIPRIFDFDFPIWKETYRAELETKILMHYYTREIGFETVGLWKLKLCEKMNLIMPYYNALYKALDQDFNPLYDTDLYRNLDGQETRDGQFDHTNNMVNTRTTKDTGTIDTDTILGGTVSDDGWRKINDTPQGGITGLDADVYITSAEHDTNKNTRDQSETTNEQRDLTSTTTDKNDGTDTRTEDVDTHKFDQEHTWGKSPGKSYSQMIKEYMENVRNIDEMVIEELNELFMLVY